MLHSEVRRLPLGTILCWPHRREYLVGELSLYTTRLRVIKFPTYCINDWISNHQSYDELNYYWNLDTDQGNIHTQFEELI